MSNILFDNNSTSFDTNVSVINWSHTINTIDNTILVIGVSWRNSGAATTTVSTVTYNSVPCTLIRKDEYFNSLSKSTALYYIINPTVGSNTVNVTFDGTIYRTVVGAISLTGVHQTNPINVHSGTSNGSGTSISTNITTTVENAWIIDALCVRNGDSAASVSGSQTERWNYLYGNTASSGINGAGSSKSLSEPGLTNMGWTAGTGTIDGWSHSVVAIHPITQTNTITFQTASGSTGNSHSINIGASGNNRLVIAVLGHESTPGDIFQGTVSVDGKTFTQAILADNPDRVGNHLEVHIIDETGLGVSNGVQTVTYTGGDATWAMHVLVFYGVKDASYTSSGIENVVIGYPVSVENISCSNGSLIFMAAGNGSAGSINNWTSPLIEATYGPNPSSAVLGTAYGIETTAQTNKTYSVNIGDGTLRSTGIVLVFDSVETQGSGESTKNYHKIESLEEQNTTSTTFIDIPNASLTFTPSTTSEIWMIFVSGLTKSSSTIEDAYEIILVINDTTVDLCSHQNSSTIVPVNGGFLLFDRITGVNTSQNVKLQYKAITGIVYVSDVRIVAAKLPDNSDFQFVKTDSIVSSLGSSLSILSHTFTPITTGNYFIICSVKHREYPSGTTSQAWFQGPDGTKHPNAASGTYHSCARDSWNPMTYIWRENLTATSKTISIGFTSSNNGLENSEHRFRKIMAFREDAWGSSNYSLVSGDSSTTGAAFLQKNFITTSVPPEAGDYISIQTMRIGGASSATARKTGEIKIGGETKLQTNLIIDRDNTNIQGYHGTTGLVNVLNTSDSLTYENGFSSPNTITVNCAESAIVVLGYFKPDKTCQMII